MHDLFGVKTILWVTIPFGNNVDDYTPGSTEDWSALNTANQRIRDLTKNYTAQQNPNRTGVTFMAEIEFGRFTDALLEWNARLLGYNTSTTTVADFDYGRELKKANRTYTQHRTDCCPRRRFCRSLAQTCSEPPPGNSDNRPPNSVSLDGIHWCMHTVGGRFYGAIACSLQCVYDRTDEDAVQCIHACNRKFVSLEPVDHRK
jgi:hypothetical protein